MVYPQRVEPKQGQESVWDYPRPPRLEPVAKRLRAILCGETIADTTHGYRVLETSHPPVYYLPPEDVRMEFLIRTPRSSFCEFKGVATYWTVKAGFKTAEDAAWGYENPTPEFMPMKGYLAFYANRMDECYVGDQKVTPQPGGFYGGWITSDIVGPFKGGAGTWGW
ncbi:DUF427 domain-containing protein [Gloeobacter violaceus]|uniref:Glr2246 protein n=1 Tax=Gloeobacter violaceus (strain ATCC 29082 / PCC 7421) TaxID=251221 RepID=Q7NID7_GLOVI|nr:DUF427 domain-containing protein [Gloeobacter violaceus]BAC90187.1 glr2246 [Gloeobacter violaceus PCC 7421]